MENLRAEKRKENKKKLVKEIANRKAYFTVLWTIYWFGWATIKQIAGNNKRSQRRISLILKNLERWKMVGSKLPFYGAKSFWYLLKKGIEVIQFEDPNRYLHIPAKKNEVPENYYNHHRAVVDRIIALQNMDYKCTSPRHSLWPPELQELSSNKKYRITPDFWIKLKEKDMDLEGREMKIMWAGVEVEHSFRGSRYFPRKLAKQQKMTFDENGRIVWFYIPTNKRTEDSLDRVIKKMRDTGKYTTKVKKTIPKEERYTNKKDKQIEIGLEKGIGFFFFNVEMMKFDIFARRENYSGSSELLEVISETREAIRRAKDIIKHPYYIFTFFCKNCEKTIFLNAKREEFDAYNDNIVWTIYCKNCGYSEEKDIKFFRNIIKEKYSVDVNFDRGSSWLTSVVEEGKIYLPGLGEKERFMKFLPY